MSVTLYRQDGLPVPKLGEFGCKWVIEVPLRLALYAGSGEWHAFQKHLMECIEDDPGKGATCVWISCSLYGQLWVAGDGERPAWLAEHELVEIETTKAELPVAAMKALPAAPSITCPRCKRTSYNPNDINERYCGNCHDWIE